MRTAIAPIPVPDEGSLRADLIAYTDELVDRFRAGRGSDVLPHLVAASCHDDELRASLDDYTRGRQATLRLLLRAVASNAASCRPTPTSTSPSRPSSDRSSTATCCRASRSTATLARRLVDRVLR